MGSPYNWFSLPMLIHNCFFFLQTCALCLIILQGSFCNVYLCLSFLLKWQPSKVKIMSLADLKVEHSSWMLLFVFPFNFYFLVKSVLVDALWLLRKISEKFLWLPVILFFLPFFLLCFRLPMQHNGFWLWHLGIH